ncbi:MAG: tetratricopeptide repeat protein [Candidatus Eisenbacteria bacterium]|nr:tetratricopeptide repeat protein [Candidatus Eisenbacteria bacterium]
MADHFQYLASLGILVPVSVLATQLLPRLPAVGQRLGLATGLALLVVLGLLTWSQTQRYRDMETLFGDVLKRNPGSWMAHVHMGTIRQSEGRVDEAMTHFQTATTINPDYFGAHINMGNIHMQDGRTLQAVKAYDRAVRLNPKDPLSHYSLGAALARLGRSDEAIDHYEQSLQLGIGPALESDARLGLGLALVSQNRPVEAIPQLESALARRPVDPEAHCGLALLLLSQGESGKAAGHFEQAVQYRPDYPEALNGLAWIRATDANPANRSGALAVRLARRAVELTGGQNPYYLDTLAAAHAEAGSFPEALAAGERALELSRAGGLSDLEEQIQDHLSDYQANRKLSVPPVGDR